LCLKKWYDIAMNPALANYSIESDSTILLSYIDGTRRRVTIDELPQHVRKRDLAKIRRAQNLRYQFINKVLPPGAMTLLLIGIILLGSYDARHAHLALPHRASATQVTAPSQSSAQPAQKSLSAGASTAQPANTPASQGPPPARSVHPPVQPVASPPAAVPSPKPSASQPQANNGGLNIQPFDSGGLHLLGLSLPRLLK
jgi:hypothetical protein